MTFIELNNTQPFPILDHVTEIPLLSVKILKSDITGLNVENLKSNITCFVSLLRMNI
jgi:hypothetical protein